MSLATRVVAFRAQARWYRAGGPSRQVRLDQSCLAVPLRPKTKFAMALGAQGINYSENYRGSIHFDPIPLCALAGVAMLLAVMSCMLETEGAAAGCIWAFTVEGEMDVA